MSGREQAGEERIGWKEREAGSIGEGRYSENGGEEGRRGGIEWEASVGGDTVGEDGTPQYLD